MTVWQVRVPSGAERDVVGNRRWVWLWPWSDGAGKQRSEREQANGGFGAGGPHFRVLLRIRRVPERP